jgi:CHAD domain-containing protein
MTTMLEEERKYAVDAAFTLPDLTDRLGEGGRVLAKPALSLKATYYDTPDLRLARAGVSLRHRRGEDLTDKRHRAAGMWTVKLPTGTVGVRQEISLPGMANAVPADVVALLTAYHRGAELGPVVTMRTRRAVYQLVDANDYVLAEVADDSVSILDGRRTVSKFREIEVERRRGKRQFLDRVGEALREAGAVEGEFVPKHIRAMGPAATAAPDLMPAPSCLPDNASAGEVVAAALCNGIGRIFEFDPLVRLREPLPEDDTAVHQMRVGCRRLRSDLRSFGPLLQPDWSSRLRTELGWLGGVLGLARDAEVLRAHLRRTASIDPLAPPDAASVARIDSDLAARHEDALETVDEALRSERYLALLELLVDAARVPQLTSEAGRDARIVLPSLVRKPWRKLVRGAGDGAVGGEDLDPAAPDEVWHEIRIRVKRARYAVEAVAGTVGRPARRLGRALADVQTLLGEHQDAVVAADTWLAIASADPDDHVLAVTAGRLYERERVAIGAVRDAYPLAWQAATRHRRTTWLHA